MQYLTKAHLNLYDSPDLIRLATQATAGRYLTICPPIHLPALTSSPYPTAFAVRLCEDDYRAWLSGGDLIHLEEITSPYQAPIVSALEVRDRLPQVIAFAQAALAVPNTYRWGGTVGPNYDCSGLVQAAFRAVGIQLPRDAYQQEAFVQPIALADCVPGDLIFFGTPAKATHVALSLGSDRYIHSSGQDQGRNGIGIDTLSPNGDAVSQAYYAQLRGAGSVMASYQPQQS